jgi:hypothetical protein
VIDPCPELRKTLNVSTESTTFAKNRSGITLLGGLFAIGIIALSVSFLTQSTLHSRRLSKTVENRIDTSLVATNILNAIATTSTEGIRSMAASAAAGSWIRKSTPALAWLGAWESSGEIRNIRVRFFAFSVVPGPTPVLSPTAYPTTMPSPSWTPEPSHQVDLELEFSRDSGKSWQKFAASKWVAR